ncbi:MAG TPA: flavodoxin domain-containing protein [Candidatus Limnocylindrales bacterium]|jgi:menaquinone-dependent protoporphyrinogen oxidase
MRAPVVLVAFASETGSTARIAAEIARELRAAGLGVTCRLAAQATALDPYDALVLGSGVYVRSRNADGGGFLIRHADAIAGKPVWLYCSGPIGRGRGAGAGVVTVDRSCTVFEVARAVGARGAAAFGSLGMDALDDDLAEPVDMARVREWAREIAAALLGSRLEAVTA